MDLKFKDKENADVLRKYISLFELFEKFIADMICNIEFCELGISYKSIEAPDFINLLIKNNIYDCLPYIGRVDNNFSFGEYGGTIKRNIGISFKMNQKVESSKTFELGKSSFNSSLEYHLRIIKAAATETLRRFVSKGKNTETTDLIDAVQTPKIYVTDAKTDKLGIYTETLDLDLGYNLSTKADVVNGNCYPAAKLNVNYNVLTVSNKLDEFVKDKDFYDKVTAYEDRTIVCKCVEDILNGVQSIIYIQHIRRLDNIVSALKSEASKRGVSMEVLLVMLKNTTIEQLVVHLDGSKHFYIILLC